MEFNRRLAVEKEIDKGETPHVGNIVFDESGYFILYSTPLGVKMVKTNSNTVKFIGKHENLRLMNIALFQVGSQGDGSSATAREVC